MKQNETKLVKERKRSQSPKTVTSSSASKLKSVISTSAIDQRVTRKSEQNPKKSFKLHQEAIPLHTPSSSTTIPIAEKLSDHCSFDLAQASKSYIFPSTSVKNKDTPLVSQFFEEDKSLSSAVQRKQNTTTIGDVNRPETIAHYSSELNTEALKICNENLLTEKSKVTVANTGKEAICEIVENEKACDTRKEGNTSKTFIEKKEEVEKSKSELKKSEQLMSEQLIPEHFQPEQPKFEQLISERPTSEQSTSEQPTSEQPTSESSSKDEPRRSGRKRSTKSFGDDTITFPLKKEKVQTPSKIESNETAAVNKDESIVPTRSSERKRLVNSKYRGEDIYTPTTKRMSQQEKSAIDHQSNSKLEKKIYITQTKTSRPVDTSAKVETRRRSSYKSKSNEEQHATSKTKKHDKQSNTKPNEIRRKSFVQDEMQVESKLIKLEQIISKPIELEETVSKPVKSTMPTKDVKQPQTPNDTKLNIALYPKATLMSLDKKLPEIIKSNESDPNSEKPITFDKQPELASNIKLRDPNAIFSKSTVSSRDEGPVEVFSNFSQTENIEKSKSAILIQDEKLDQEININETPIQSVHCQEKQHKEISSALSCDSIRDVSNKEVSTENHQMATDIFNLLNNPTQQTKHNEQSDLATSHLSLSKEIEKPTNTTCNKILPDHNLKETIKTVDEKPVIKKTKVEKSVPGKPANKNFEEKYELFKQKWKAEKEKRRLMKETQSSKLSVSAASTKPSQQQVTSSSVSHKENTTALPQPKPAPISLAQISTIKNTSEKDQLVRSSKEKPLYSSQQGTKTGPTLTQLVASKLHKKAQAHQKQRQEAESERKTSGEEIDLTAITLRSMKSPPRFDEKSSNSKKKSLDFITGRLNYKKKMELLKSEAKQQKCSTDYLQSPPLSGHTIQDQMMQAQYNNTTNPVNCNNETLKISALPSSSNCSLSSQTTPITDYKNREMKTPDKNMNKLKGLFIYLS